MSNKDNTEEAFQHVSQRRHPPLRNDGGEDEIDPQILRYKKRLSVLLEDIEEIHSAGIAATGNTAQIPLFRGMFRSLQSLYDKFMSLHDELVDALGAQDISKDDRQRRVLAKQYYYGACTYAENFKINLPFSGDISTSTLNQTVTSSRSRAKLPTINLPEFDGERTQWQRFKDTFQSLVISDPELSPMDKFHYLHAALNGSAASIIAQIPISEANFSIAWKALLDMYDNHRLIATAYLDKLINMKPLPVKPSTEQLTAITSQICEMVGAFNQIEMRDRADFLMFYLARRCLDPQSKEAFELRQEHNTFPTFDELIKFLRQRCTASELATGIASPMLTSEFKLAMQSNAPKYGVKPLSWKPRMKTSLVVSPSDGKDVGAPSSSSKLNQTRFSHSLPSTPRNPKCPACSNEHLLFKCPNFIGMSMERRIACLENWKGCRNCLSPFHQTRRCISKKRCRICNGRHNSLLHDNSLCNEVRRSITYLNKSSPKVEDKRQPRPSTQSLSTLSPKTLQVVLGTACCYLLDSHGNPHPIRLVLDSGSQFSFLSREVATRLGLNVKSCNIDIMGIGQTPFSGFKGRVCCRLVSSVERIEVSTQALVVDTITSALPSLPIPEHVKIPYQKYLLADPQFWDPQPVDFLLGGDLFPDILTGEIVTIADKQPKLVGTIFGYVVLGRMMDVVQAHHASVLCTTGCIRPYSYDDAALTEDLTWLWELEDPPDSKSEDPIAQKCEEFFQKTHYRLSSGRYVVRLPFKQTPPTFPSIRWQAIKRLNNIETKLLRDNKLRKMYTEFMEEYESLGHMHRAASPGKYIIRHHGVLKLEGRCQKIRVVFDGSARTSAGSINDYLLAGPKLQCNMVVILLNFRQHEIVFTVDLVKMYRQILVHPLDRGYQHILWRPQPSEPLKEFELCTVTYGLSCAPYLALRSIQQLWQDEGKDFPLAAKVLRKQMYVDNIVTGAKTIEEALELQRHVIGIMNKGEFPLSKWKSNHPQLLEVSEANDRTTNDIPRNIEHPEDRTRVKILGLQWDPKNDAFGYEVSVPALVCTKRALLAAVSRIYDPLGLLGPVVIKEKCLIQLAWKLNLSWDEPLPLSLQEHWSHFVKQLPYISEMRIPRLVCSNNALSYDLLIFGDASELAFCASAYLRTQLTHEVKVNLLLSKIKLAPIKTISIPRLELCAALLAVKLKEILNDFCTELSPPPRVSLYTDSSVVLGWLNTPPYQLQTFVANRVSYILESTHGSQWMHVRSQDNPSDIGSRGTDVFTLKNNSAWFHGPEWAISDPQTWPVKSINSFKSDSFTLPELKAFTSLAVTSPSDDWLLGEINRTSSYVTLLRRFAWLQRFISNCQSSREKRKTGELTLHETQQSFTFIVKATQRLEFTSGKSMNATNIPKTLMSLNPFLDTDGVLRVGGRLSQAKLPYHSRHPILLPAKCHLAALLVEYHHRCWMHPGPNLLLSMLRRRFWIVGARNLIRHFSRKCVKCLRSRASPCKPMMADISAARLQEGKAFNVVGIDFAGPFMVRESLRRKAPLSKCYMCLFICLGSRGIHLEAVSSASTPAFLAAFERFVSRRGLPNEILSDNGTNFVGASNHLKELYEWYRHKDSQSALQMHATRQEVKWSFIPPYAPHWGGKLGSWGKVG